MQCCYILCYKIVIRLRTKFVFKKKHLNSARDDIDAITNYAGSSTNRELRACFKHSVRQITTKEAHQMSVQNKLTVSSNSN